MKWFCFVFLAAEISNGNDGTKGPYLSYLFYMYIFLLYHFSFWIADPRAPSLEIRVFSAFSKVMLTGHNFSVACTSNKSKVYTDYVEDAQLEEISMFFGNSTPIKVCGSADEPKEDTKTCTLVISNATLGSSGYYSCMAMNSMRCTTATIFVKVEGIYINNK